MADNFIHEIIEKDLENQKYGDKVYTRFPPEPNGYLHIGHAKSILLNYGLAQKYNGKFNMRFDDTNPTKEKVEFVDSIKADIEWLGADWEDRLFFASDYFPQMYEGAVKLIKKGKAYVSDLTAEQIREYRGTLTEPGKEDPGTARSVEENLEMGAYVRPNSEVDDSIAAVYEQFPRLKERRKQIAGTLSGGEQQMLAMSRALMSHPKLMMLDEPSMGLAPILVDQIFEIIKELHKAGTTILLVEQNARKALQIADRAYVLETGNITLSGTGAELASSDAVKKAYLGG